MHQIRSASTQARGTRVYLFNDLADVLGFTARVPLFDRGLEHTRGALDITYPPSIC